MSRLICGLSACNDPADGDVQKAQREFGMRSAGTFSARPYKPLITILSLPLHTPSHETPKTKVLEAPIDGCFPPASLLVTGVMAVIEISVRTDHE